MPVKNLEDDEGESMTVVDIDGYYIFNWPMADLEKNFKSIPDWTTRQSDIYLCTYPKSGLHWTWEIITMLVNRSAERIWLPHTPTMEFLTQEEFDKMWSPRVVTTHLRMDQLPRDLVTRKCKIVMCHRNPKDVMVSFYHHHLALKQYGYKGEWTNYFKRFMEGLIDFGSWFEYMRYWDDVIKENPHLHVHVMYYEDLQKNGIREIQKLAKYLEVEDDMDLSKRIHEACHFEKMKKDKDEVANESIKAEKSSSFYRKGVIGDWKNWFTVAQNEYFDSEYRRRMKDSNLCFTFSD